MMAGKKMGLQTYSLGQELLKDLPNGLQRLKKMGYTDLEIFGYRPDTGKFGDYNPQNKLFISAKEYKNKCPWEVPMDWAFRRVSRQPSARA